MSTWWRVLPSPVDAVRAGVSIASGSCSSLPQSRPLYGALEARHVRRAGAIAKPTARTGGDSNSKERGKTSSANARA